MTASPKVTDRTRQLRLWISILTIVGLADATYLTFEHYLGTIPPCSVAGCEQVLTSQYATVAEIPISLFGAFYYLIVLVLSRLRDRRSEVLLAIIVGTGVLTSAGLVYLQLAVLRAICLYCMVSAGVSFALGGLTWALLKQPSKQREESHATD